MWVGPYYPEWYLPTIRTNISTRFLRKATLEEREKKLLGNPIVDYV